MIIEKILTKGNKIRNCIKGLKQIANIQLHFDVRIMPVNEASYIHVYMYMYLLVYSPVMH